MKFKINKNWLVSALEKVSKALTNKSGNVSLSGIKIEASKSNSVTLTAANYEYSIKVEIKDVNVEETGDVLISGKHFVEIVKKLDDDLIDIYSCSNETTIGGTKSYLTLRNIDTSLFPKTQNGNWKAEINLNSADLVSIVKKVGFAASTNNSRQMLLGIDFKLKDKVLTVVASDSYRVAKKSIAVDDGSTINALIPAASLNELVKIIDRAEINIKLSATHVLFAFNDCELESRLIDCKYPDVDSFMPKSFFTNITLSRHELINALERINIVFDNSSASIVKVDFRQNFESIFKTGITELGRAQEVIFSKEISEPLKDKAYEMCISSKFLLDAVKTFEDDDITFNLGDVNTKPMTITSTKDTDLIHLILPVRVS